MSSYAEQLQEDEIPQNTMELTPKVLYYRISLSMHEGCLVREKENAIFEHLPYIFCCLAILKAHFLGVNNDIS